NRPKPAGFGVGKTYTTDVEEQLLREMGIGAAGRKSNSAPPKSVKTNGSATETGADRSNDGVHVRIWNLPKKKNIHKDLNLAFKGFPGLVTINPANSGTKKTRDPICKGFAFVKLESVDAATRVR
uniref:RRM domain-containing protein n=1 Tax=Aegilops tauschii subsp. strangulata TaxID=200361 RepID=A0A453REP0_AEGTS